MNTIINFDLNDPYDENRLKRCLAADQAFLALWNVVEVLREDVRNGGGVHGSKRVEALLEKAQNKIPFDIEELMDGL